MNKIWKQYAKERYQRILGILALWGFLDFYLFFLCDADFYVWDLVYLNLLLGMEARGRTAEKRTFAAEKISGRFIRLYCQVVT